MEIILAENHGFCYGVKRAVEMANEAADSDGKSYTLGPIIHNPQVVGRDVYKRQTRRYIT